MHTLFLIFIFIVALGLMFWALYCYFSALFEKSSKLAIKGTLIFVVGLILCFYGAYLGTGKVVNVVNTFNGKPRNATTIFTDVFRFTPDSTVHFTKATDAAAPIIADKIVLEFTCTATTTKKILQQHNYLKQSNTTTDTIHQYYCTENKLEHYLSIKKDSSLVKYTNY